MSNIINTIVNRGAVAVFGALLLLAGGAAQQVNAQRDPFAKPYIAPVRSKIAKPNITAAKPKPLPPVPKPVGVPPIEQRIENYKMLRRLAAERGVPAPKPTAVLTLDEMQVTGIFRTPRGYSAMVEATPIKLSYTIYPGERFYDGQLVAIEDGRLVFRRLTRMTDGKVLTVAENKALRQQQINEMSVPRAAETAAAQPAAGQQTAAAVPPVPVVPQTAPTAQSATATGVAAEPTTRPTATVSAPVQTADNSSKPAGVNGYAGEAIDLKQYGLGSTAEPAKTNAPAVKGGKQPVRKAVKPRN